MTKFKYADGFNKEKLISEFNARFSKNPRYNPVALSDLLTLVRYLEQDNQISDLRWAAYMLATVFWETTSPVTVITPKTRKGKPVFDKRGRPVLLKSRRWLMTMAPVNEVGYGKGRNYHEPVKVSRTADGGAIVVEQDGDVFTVSAAGIIKTNNKKALMGTIDGGAADKSYLNDKGQENAYFGRGYVQLTWWSNYVKAGVSLGRGLDLLFDPELVKDAAVAYALMSYGMRTGSGFANGKMFAHYLSGQRTDYEGARAMVNGNDHAADIAALAIEFENVLRASALNIYGE
jgi:hypothetical protein